MTVIRGADLAPETPVSGYPPPHDRPAAGFRLRAFSAAGGLTRFGAAEEVLDPGETVSHLHWHEREDEFLYLIAGELTVIEGLGPTETRTVLHPGDAACWPAGVPVGHAIRNMSDRPCTYLIVGSRAAEETAHYPGRDLIYRRDAAGTRYTHLDGTPYPQRLPDAQEDTE